MLIDPIKWRLSIGWSLILNCWSGADSCQPSSWINQGTCGIYILFSQVCEQNRCQNYMHAWFQAWLWCLGACNLPTQRREHLHAVACRMQAACIDRKQFRTVFIAVFWQFLQIRAEERNMHRTTIALETFDSKNAGGTIVVLESLSPHWIWEPNLYKTGTHFGIFGTITSCDNACTIQWCLA